MIWCQLHRGGGRVGMGLGLMGAVPTQVLPAGLAADQTRGWPDTQTRVTLSAVMLSFITDMHIIKARVIIWVTLALRRPELALF